MIFSRSLILVEPFLFHTDREVLHTSWIIQLTACNTFPLSFACYSFHTLLCVFYKTECYKAENDQTELFKKLREAVIWATSLIFFSICWEVENHMYRLYESKQSTVVQNPTWNQDCQHLLLTWICTCTIWMRFRDASALRKKPNKDLDQYDSFDRAKVKNRRKIKTQ